MPQPDKLPKIHEIQPAVLHLIREGYLKAGERPDYEHEGRRRKIFGRFLGQCDSFADGKKSAHEQRFSVVRRTGSLIGGMTG